MWTQKRGFELTILIVTLIAVFAMAAQHHVDTDTWWHLSAGKWMVTNEEIIQVDHFSFTRGGTSWEYPGWLAQLLMYAAFLLGDLLGLNLLAALLVVLVYIVVWFSLEGLPLVRAFIIVLSASASSVFWSMRPHLFSFLFSAVFILILERNRKNAGNRLWLLPVVMLVWGNMHGGFAVGFLLMGVYAIAELYHLTQLALQDSPPLAAFSRGMGAVLRKFTAPVVACILALALNPTGPAMILYPFKMIYQDIHKQINEWQSPDFHLLNMQVFLFLFFLLCLVLIRSKQKVELREFLLTFGFGFMAFYSARNIQIFSIVVLPVLATHITAQLKPLLKSSSPPAFSAAVSNVINAVLVLVLIFIVIVVRAPFFSQQYGEEANASFLPVEAIDYLAAQKLPAPVYNNYGWGGYFIWRLYPAYQSFVDGRADLFGDEILQDYLSVYNAAEAWPDLVDEWGIATFLVPNDAPVRFALEADDWIVVYQDEMASILVRPQP